MKLCKFIIINHKSSKSVSVELEDNKVKTFIGVNDAGKSTILKSLKLFFDEKPSVFFESENTKRSILANTPLTKQEFEDLFKDEGLTVPDFYDEKSIGILCIFEKDDASTINDLDEKGISPHFQCALNGSSDSRIYLLKLFSADGNNSNYYLLTPDELLADGNYLELWKASQTAIKSKQSELGIEEVSIENRNSAGTLKNIERIFAIYNRANTVPTWALYASFKKDKDMFPAFRYLDWNVTTEELNQLTADVIKPIVEGKVKGIQSQINTERDNINKEANEALKTIYGKYSKSLPESITGLSANVNLNLQQSVTELFVEKATSDSSVYIDDQGDGIKRQISLGLIKARAEEAVGDDNAAKKYIWCFDEPETHLFPMAQRDLANSLSKLAETQFQVLVSTHSTLFVDKSNLSDINLVSVDPETHYTVIAKSNETNDIYQSLGVKNSDFLFYDRFLAVEGPTEYGSFNHFYKLIYKSDLSADGIQLINLQGKDNRDNQRRLMEQIFEDFQKQEDITIYALDKDSRVSQDNVVLVGEVADIEDAFSNDIWMSIVNTYCGASITVETLDEMRSNISITEKDKKLHIMLAKYVAEQKEQNDAISYLPTKGELAEVLMKYVDDESKIPKSIKCVFEKVRQGI